MISFQSILHLYDVITHLGDIGTWTQSQLKKYGKYENRIREAYVKEAKRANTRLRALEEKGLTASPAYERATFFTAEERSSLRFSQSKRMSLSEMMRSYEEVNAFLADETSSIPGERWRQAGINKILPGGSPSEKNAMLRFLDSAAFNDLKKTIGTDVVKMAADAIESGAEVSDLNRLYKDYLKREAEGSLTVDEDLYTEVWSMWAGDFMEV